MAIDEVGSMEAAIVDFQGIHILRSDGDPLASVLSL